MNKPAIMSFTPLHYGADYLPYAIAALYPFCDELLIAYTKEPSYGHRSKSVCPESQGQLRDAAYSLVGDGAKIRWVEGQWNTEGEHRNEATLHARKHGFDVVLSVDSDEIVAPESVQYAIEYAAADTDHWLFQVNFIHFWRSLNTVCRDGQMPVRIQNVRNHGKPQGQVQLPKPFYHFGYAIRDEIMAYKFGGIHGHQSELRPEWFKDVWYNSLRCDDLHPVSRNFWNAESFDKTTLPELMKTHPFYNTERIQ